MERVSPRAYVRLLRRNRNFRLLWLAQIVSELGDWLYSVAIYSLLLQFTGSARSVAFAFVCQVLPQFFVAPAAGVINDRVSRKRVMITADWARAVIVLCMVLVRGPERIAFLYLLLVLETVFWALFEPGHTAVIPNIATGAEVVAANALSSTTWSFNFAVGAALGGFLATYFGRDTVFVLNALSFVVSALLISRMRFAEPHAEGRTPFRARDLMDFSPIAEGIRYVSRDRRLLATMFVKSGLGFMGANWVILPIFGERVFPIYRPGFSASQAGTLGMSVLLASRGIGALTGPFLASYWAGQDKQRMRAGILVGFGAAALGYMALGAAPALPLACLAVMLAHGGGSIVWVFSTVLLQLQTEDRFRGRVFSAEFAFGVVTMSLSSSAAGALVDHGRPVTAAATLTGAVVLIPAVAWAWALRSWPGEPEPQPESRG